MTSALANRAVQYAAAHPQAVVLAWIDGTRRTYTAERAANLCGDCRIAACLVGASCVDKYLNELLDQLIDERGDN